MFRKSYLTIVGAITLLLLAAAPVYAAPSLGLGSKASYDLTGKLEADQSCTTDQVSYASQACLGYSSFPISTAYVTIFDDGRCLPGGYSSCNFSPSFVSIPQGGSVHWTVSGTLQHNVKSNNTANIGLPSFSGNITQYGTFFVTFVQPGTYQYYDLTYNWLKGTILVTPPPPPPPPPAPTSFRLDLSGTVGWNVEGLSTSQANLLVSHDIAVSVSPVPGLTITPVTETGSFEQSINLSTRVESPGTAASVVRSLLTRLVPALSGYTLATGVTGQVYQTMLSGQTNGPDYTEWWVNGPLTNGSPVQLLHGWSSVTGSEDLNLGDNIGTRSAWIVTSQISQTFDVNIPNPNNPLNPPTAKVDLNFKFLWSYDKSADLLLRNDDTFRLTVHSVTPTTIYTPTPCGQTFCTNAVTVTVTRDMALTVNIALRLSETNLSLHSSGSAGPQDQTSTFMNLFSALPWMPLGIAGLAAGISGAFAIWLTRRAKHATMPGPTPEVAPAASPANP